MVNNITSIQVKVAAWFHLHCFQLWAIGLKKNSVQYSVNELNTGL